MFNPIRGWLQKKASKQRGASALDRLKDKIDSYPIRERVLFFLFFCIVTFAFWYFIFLKPLQKSRSEIMLRIKVEQQQITNIKEKYDDMVKKSNDPAEGQKREALSQEIIRLDQKIYGITHQVLPSSKMIELLKGLLKQNPQLTFVSLRSMPAINMNPVSEENQKDSTKELSQLVGETYLQQQFQLTFKGGFFGMLKYLGEVENSEWRVFWDALIYDVPNSLMAISVHSLIHEKSDLYSNMSINKAGHE